MINSNNKADFLAQIIDVFEDFLAEKEAIPFSTEPQEGNDSDIPVYFYGKDYYEIEDKLSEIMKAWEVIG